MTSEVALLRSDRISLPVGFLWALKSLAVADHPLTKQSKAVRKFIFSIHTNTSFISIEDKLVAMEEYDKSWEKVNPSVKAFCCWGKKLHLHNFINILRKERSLFKIIFYELC